MGIQHFDDLTPTQFLEAIATMDQFSSKFDGSFLAFGIDLQGRFFTQRKSGQCYYDISEWPEEGWANGFRQAHMVLDAFMDYHQKMNAAGRGSLATCEVINGHQPNVVEHHSSNTIWIHPGSNFEFGNFHVDIAAKVLIPDSAAHIHKVIQPYKWWIRGISQNDIKKYKFDSYDLVKDVKFWLEAPSSVLPYSKRRIIEFNLNTKPAGLTSKAWKNIKFLIKEERSKLREEFQTKLLNIKKKWMLNISNLSYRTSEGVVVTGTSALTFKLVNREWFAEANRFVHWVKYALVGGRRPPRPSFDSRTKDWPIEKKLKRLEILRQRYLKHRHLLKKKINGQVYEYDSELHERTLLLFHDLKERIKNGRTGIQRINTSYSTSRDTSDAAMAG